MFSPRGFEQGIMFYNITIYLPQHAHRSLSPFELFREPLMILGIADGTENKLAGGIDPDKSKEASSPHLDANSLQPEASILGNFEHTLEEQYPRALLRRLLIFDCPYSHPIVSIPEEAILIPPQSHIQYNAVKKVMYDLTARLLEEMASYARSLQALPTIASPSTSQPSSSRAADIHRSEDFSAIQPQIDVQKRDSSFVDSPSPEHFHSQPDIATDAQVPVEESGHAVNATEFQPNSSGTGLKASPATTFDEMNGVTTQGFGSASIDSVPKFASSNGLQDVNKDRVSMHGFGSGSMSERQRNKGKGRVGMTIGSLYLHAGRWPDALQEFINNTTRARSFSDHLWHAKGLENILVCLLLLMWAGIETKVSLELHMPPLWLLVI
jgi:trafficking protein particle complex subunit 9